MTWNTTSLSLDKTARTCEECAGLRAENLAILGVRKVLELCVGPSLRVLERAYRGQGIECWGNDVDIRWKHYYESGKWIIGDALSIDVRGFDCCVFAPPVTRGCT
jgi:hypothetical protein